MIHKYPKAQPSTTWPQLGSILDQFWSIFGPILAPIWSKFRASSVTLIHKYPRAQPSTQINRNIQKILRNSHMSYALKSLVLPERRSERSERRSALKSRFSHTSRCTQSYPHAPRHKDIQGIPRKTTKHTKHRNIQKIVRHSHMS